MSYFAAEEGSESVVLALPSAAVATTAAMQPNAPATAPAARLSDAAAGTSNRANQERTTSAAVLLQQLKRVLPSQPSTCGKASSSSDSRQLLLPQDVADALAAAICGDSSVNSLPSASAAAAGMSSQAAGQNRYLSLQAAISAMAAAAIADLEACGQRWVMYTGVTACLVHWST